MQQAGVDAVVAFSALLTSIAPVLDPTSPALDLADDAAEHRFSSASGDAGGVEQIPFERLPQPELGKDGHLCCINPRACDYSVAFGWPIELRRPGIEAIRAHAFKARVVAASGTIARA